MMPFTVISECRSCKSKELEIVLDLTDQSPANQLSSNPYSNFNKYPLTLVVCINCDLPQLSVDVKNTQMFDEYNWVTGTSDMAKTEANNIFNILIKYFEKNDIPNVKVLEIASNDGTFLKPFLDSGIQNLGIEPARNIAEIASNSGIETLVSYFDDNLAQTIKRERGEFDIIIARNVIAHVSDPLDFMNGVARILSSSGICYIEFHDAKSVFEELQYDSIYHEHASYFSLETFGNLCSRVGLEILGTRKSPIGGGNLGILLASRNKNAPGKENKLDLTNKIGIRKWLEWSEQVILHKKKFNATIAQLNNERIIGWGASARGITLINYLGISRKLIAIVDNNPLKQGKYLPSSNVEILSFDQGLTLNPNVIICLAWNFEKEFEKQILNTGYKGIVVNPLPRIKLRNY